MGAWPSQNCPCQEKPIRLVAERQNCSDLLNGQAGPAAVVMPTYVAEWLSLCAWSGVWFVKDHGCTRGGCFERILPYSLGPLER